MDQSDQGQFDEVVESICRSSEVASTSAHPASSFGSPNPPTSPRTGVVRQKGAPAAKRCFTFLPRVSKAFSQFLLLFYALFCNFSSHSAQKVGIIGVLLNALLFLVVGRIAAAPVKIFCSNLYNFFQHFVAAVKRSFGIVRWYVVNFASTVVRITKAIGQSAIYIYKCFAATLNFIIFLMESAVLLYCMALSVEVLPWVFEMIDALVALVGYSLVLVAWLAHIVFTTAITLVSCLHTCANFLTLFTHAALHLISTGVSLALALASLLHNTLEAILALLSLLHMAADFLELFIHTSFALFSITISTFVSDLVGVAAVVEKAGMWFTSTFVEALVSIDSVALAVGWTSVEAFVVALLIVVSPHLERPFVNKCFDVPKVPEVDDTIEARKDDQSLEAKPIVLVQELKAGIVGVGLLVNSSTVKEVV